MSSSHKILALYNGRRWKVTTFKEHGEKGIAVLDGAVVLLDVVVFSFLDFVCFLSFFPSSSFFTRFFNAIRSSALRLREKWTRTTTHAPITLKLIITVLYSSLPNHAPTVVATKRTPQRTWCCCRNPFQPAITTRVFNTPSVTITSGL